MSRKLSLNGAPHAENLSSQPTPHGSKPSNQSIEPPNKRVKVGATSIPVIPIAPPLPAKPSKAASKTLTKKKLLEFDKANPREGRIDPDRPSQRQNHFQRGLVSESDREELSEAGESAVKQLLSVFKRAYTAAVYPPRRHQASRQEPIPASEKPSETLRYGGISQQGKGTVGTRKKPALVDASQTL